MTRKIEKISERVIKRKTKGVVISGEELRKCLVELLTKEDNLLLDGRKIHVSRLNIAQRGSVGQIDLTRGDAIDGVLVEWEEDEPVTYEAIRNER